MSEIIRDPRLTSQKYGQFYYSNIGYTLLARVVEIVTSFDFEMYVNFKLLRPLKAFQSGLYHRSKIIKSLATGYYRNEDNHYQRLCCVDFSTNMGSIVPLIPNLVCTSLMMVLVVATPLA